MRVGCLEIAFLHTLLAFSPDEFRIVNSFTRDNLLQASKDGSLIPVQAREIEVAVGSSNGKELSQSLTVLFEPQSSFYLWLLVDSSGEVFHPEQLAYKATRSAVAIGDGRMVWFVMGHPDLFLIESIRRASSLDDACQRTLREMTQKSLSSNQNKWHQSLNLRIGTRLGQIGDGARSDFFAPDHGPAPLFPSVKVEAAYTGTAWDITLEANLKVKLILGHRFEIVSLE